MSQLVSDATETYYINFMAGSPDYSIEYSYDTDKTAFKVDMTVKGFDATYIGDGSQTYNGYYVMLAYGLGAVGSIYPSNMILCNTYYANSAASDFSCALYSADKTGAVTKATSTDISTITQTTNNLQPSSGTSDATFSFYITIPYFLANENF